MLLQEIDIYNLDGFMNESYNQQGYSDTLERQLEALQDKLNEVIGVLNDTK